MKISEEGRLAFCAGVLEGEACFDIRKSNALKRDPQNKSVRIIVEMKDRDVLEKLRYQFGGTINPVLCKSKIKENWSPYFKWLLSDRDGIYNCLLQIEPFMSTRRKERIEEMIHFIERKQIENR